MGLILDFNGSARYLLSTRALSLEENHQPAAWQYGFVDPRELEPLTFPMNIGVLGGRWGTRTLDLSHVKRTL